MKNLIRTELKKVLPPEFYHSGSLSFNSLNEEALKLSLRYENNPQLGVIVKENSYAANNLYRRMQAFFTDEELVLYTPEESMRAEAIAASYENRAERVNALVNICQNKQKLKVIITTAYGLIRHLPHRGELEKLTLTLHLGQSYSKEALIATLKKCAYEGVLRAEHPLTYAARGAIVDVFSVNYNDPIRIEFDDEEIVSLRFYDVNSQRTSRTITECTIIAAGDIIFTAEEEAFLVKELAAYNSSLLEVDLDYLTHHIYEGRLYYYYAFLPKHVHLLDYLTNYELYLSDKAALIEHLKELAADTYAYLEEKSESENLPLRFNVFADFTQQLAGKKTLQGESFHDLPLIETVDLPYLPLETALLTILKRKKTRIVFALNTKEIKEVKEKLNELKIEYTEVKDNFNEGINLLAMPLAEGFSCQRANLTVYSAKELFHASRRSGRYARKYAEATSLNSYDELKKGDYVVHNQYGIGQYAGIENRKVNGVRLDYLRILYRGGDELLVPLAQFSLVRKYVSKEGAAPRLHRLGSKEWQKTKEKVEEDVDALAGRLLELYSLRNSTAGFAFPKDDQLQNAFEEEFSYELTGDQTVALAEIKKDMESSKPMDRLLCGDVGFGKTELAIRAAMKAVRAHKQVIYLCPTTILSLQHANTFKERFHNYPINIALLNRYVARNDQKSIIDGFKTGRIDILIGTHRVLSNDVRANDLGLLIVDEEQRFGVEQKEKIKELKKTIDVLALSATPIPRTLQMSLIGLRGLSTLDEPPKNRYPVQTYVVEKNAALIKEVIARELGRNGQVFYLYNDVEHIYSVERKLHQLLPLARIVVGHGKMNAEELEDVILDFYQGRADVLLCTTIIETGIDIANANTVIIENAQNFGLAQLYQIKGRVGRSDRLAYAYLLVPPQKELSEISAKRLKSIKEFTALGSGYKIALRDLAIRGAGDLLGEKQSGFIDNVGLDLYLTMLETAIAKRKGEKVQETTPTFFPQINVDSYIPQNFTQNDYEKLSLYHRLEAIDNRNDLFDFYLAIKDEFGRLPSEIEALFTKKRLALLLDLQYLADYRTKNDRLTVILTPEFSAQVDGMKLFAYCNKLSRDLRIRYLNYRIEISVPNYKDQRAKILTVLDHLTEMKKTCVSTNT